MQHWEYKIVFRSRVWEPLTKGVPVQKATDWKNHIGETEIKKDIDKILAELGQEGWELVGISSNSDFLGAYYSYENRTVTGTGSIHIPSQDFAGYTTSEKWVFKRPKS